MAELEIDPAEKRTYYFWSEEQDEHGMPRDFAIYTVWAGKTDQVVRGWTVFFVLPAGTAKSNGFESIEAPLETAWSLLEEKLRRAHPAARIKMRVEGIDNR